MAKDWIIEVLGDLRGFSAANGLPNLAEQLDEAIAVAMTELAQTAPTLEAEWNGAQAGRPAGTAP